jgi:glycosyltransferase involved in cell wall biosynthesis
LRVLCVTGMYPELKDPAFGSFVASLNRGLEKFTDCTVDVLRREDGARGMGSYLGMTARGIRRSVGERNYDLVHGHYIGVASGVAWTMAQFLRVPLVLTAHGSDVESAQAPAARLIQKQLYRQCSGLHFVSEPLRLRAEQLIGSWETPTLVAPTGVELSTFSPNGNKHLSSVHRKRILMVGQTVAHKGWEDGIQALALLRQAGVDAELVALGGPRIDWLQEMANDAGVGQALVCEGQMPLSDLPAYYRGADVVMVASHREGFGLVALEAMACGTPLVSTGVGGMQSYTTDGVNALVGKVHSPESLAEKIQYVLGNAATRDAIVAGGLETAERFSVESSAKKVETFYRTVLGPRSET